MLEKLILGKLSLDVFPKDALTLYLGGGVLFSGGAFILGTITYLKKWRYLWEEWVCSVDHKKIGVMYVILAFVMFFRALIQAMIMRSQQAVAVGPGKVGFMAPELYNQFFSEHGVIMIFFVAMPLIFGLINLIFSLIRGLFFLPGSLERSSTVYSFSLFMSDRPKDKPTDGRSDRPGY